jgi:hypothetical protein
MRRTDIGSGQFTDSRHRIERYHRKADANTQEKTTLTARAY